MNLWLHELIWSIATLPDGSAGGWGNDMIEMVEVELNSCAHFKGFGQSIKHNYESLDFLHEVCHRQSWMLCSAWKRCCCIDLWINIIMCKSVTGCQGRRKGLYYVDSTGLKHIPLLPKSAVWIQSYELFKKTAKFLMSTVVFVVV